MTTREKEVLKCIIRSIIKRGYAPSNEELRVKFSLGRTTVVRCLLALDSEGYLRYAGNTRAIQVLRYPDGRPVKLTFQLNQEEA